MFNFTYTCNYKDTMSAGKMLEHLNQMGLKRTVDRKPDGSWRIAAYVTTCEEMIRVGRFDKYLVSKEEAAA